MKKDVGVDNNVTEWENLVRTGNEFYTQKSYSQAELQFASALSVAEKFTSADFLVDKSPEDIQHLRVCLAKSLNNMAAVYHSQGKYSMAEDLLLRCLELKKQIYGERHLEVAVNLHNLAVMYSARRRYEEAEPLYRQSIAIREEVLGSSDRELIPVLQNYNLLLKRMHREEDALAVEEKIDRIEPRNEG
jgi:tetratricopeptide (TPR) repeat protein